ncbi:cyclin-dependent kinase G-2 isoform X1 [Asparagus officinalis]|uniref:cyclin-dependent kinase G-2 isoform X1 n=1 Tax=Asparagus officinalis TaxID=4686 RepID=UPI00098E48CA|nr:cyclin-dependent kinase G-2 isoform X1 [Asparagus officinalis]
MAAGRHGDYRDRDSDLEASRRKDYCSDRERSRSEDLRSKLRVRPRDVKDREAVNGSYRSPMSNSSGGSGNGHKRSYLSVKSADREPGELSSGEEDSRVNTSDEVSRVEEKKRKFSPIVWDRDDIKQSGAVSSRSKNVMVEGVGLPPPPPLPRGFIPSTSMDAKVSADSANDREPGQVEEEVEEEFPLARHISSSRWADTDEHEELDERILPKKRKNTPLTEKKPPSPELGEVVMREGSEGAISKSSGSSRENREGSDRENEVDKNDFMDVDMEQVNGDDRSDRMSDTDSEDEDRAKTPEPENPPQRTINMLQGCRSVDEFERLNKIDEGTYGVVYRAKDKKTGEVVALKKVKMEKEREGFPLTSLREINILLSFHHPSIVDVKEVVVGSSLDSIFMVMEYMEHDLKALMETMKQPFSQSEVKCLMLQLLSGVKYLHDNWVLHRDLKTSNLLLNNQGELKICDFGLARQYGSPLKPYTHLVVTLWYRSPELLLGAKEYSTAIDMWSLGCIMAELLAKEPLFSGKTEFDQLDKIFRTLGTPNEKIWPGFAKLPGVKVNFVRQPYNRLREKFPPTSFSGRPTLSEAGFDLLNKLLTYDPEKRITAEAALDHDWFREVPLPKSKDFMPTFPAQHAQDRRLRRIMKSPDPLEEQRRKELQLGDKLGSGGLFG